MTKYRIRLTNGRVIGPFDLKQLFELKAKGHIKGGEEAQVFPTGNWGPIETAEFYAELMDEDRTVVETEQSSTEHTFVIDLTKIRTQKNEKEIEALIEEPIGAIEELTETVRMAPAEQKVTLAELENLKAESEPAAVTPEVESIEMDNSEKTLINPVAQEEIEKIRRQQREEEERKAKEEEERLRAEEEAKQQALILATENAPVSASDSTQMIKLDKTGLIETAEEAELEIEKEFKLVQKKKALEEKESEDDEEEDDEAAEKKKKKLILILVAALGIAYALFFPEEKPQRPPFQHLSAQIKFPIPFDQADEQQSKAAYNMGLKNFEEGTYPSVIKAGNNFRVSYENNLDNIAALNFMMRSYGEQLRYNKDDIQSIHTVFNLVQGKRPFLIQDPNGVIGLSLFYSAINKENAAIDVIQKYLKLNPQNVTQDLFATYLRALMKKGKIDLAKQFYVALEKAPEKTHYSYSALIDYHLLNQETEKALEYANEGIKKYPKLAEFYLKKADILIKNRLPDDAIPLINKVEEINLNYNNIYRAKFLELKGLIYGLKNKPEEAAKYLGASLKLNDSDELRMKLADLGTSGGAVKDADRIINESKAVRFLLQAKDFYNKGSYELALSSAAKATDAFPGHIPSSLFFAKTQLKLGLAEQGLKTLEGLVAKYPKDKNINFALIDAYIDTYKFHDAKNRIQIISSTEYRDSWEYASLNAKLFRKMGDSLQTMSWLQNAISLNPVNDEDIYALSEILLKRANFKNARIYLNRCMELDPVNPDYRIAYARLIYETEDDQAAIGYLLSLLDEFGDSAKVLSEIAIFYYRSGQVKAFQQYKERLEKHHSKDAALYQFLIKAALLDERHKDIPPLVEKLLTIEPGDLESMMTAGRVLFESGNLIEAAKWFKRIQDKLSTYPKVLYYIARIDYLSGDLDGAMEKINQDLKENGENDVDLVFKAEIHQAKSEFVEAENLYKKAQKLNPKSYEAVVGLADISTKRNNHDLALDLYRRAIKLRNDEPEVHRKMGDVYRQLGQGALAIESYKMYLEMAPESPHKSNLEAYINLMK